MYDRITFLNGDQKVLSKAKETLWERAEDFGKLMHGEDLDGIDLWDYGLCIDYNPDEDYIYYQLSTGGYGEELRFHPDGTIEFVYLDWFVGVGFDVSSQEWAQWVRDEIFAVGYDFNYYRQKEGYYER